MTAALALVGLALRVIATLLYRDEPGLASVALEGVVAVGMWIAPVGLLLSNALLVARGPRLARGFGIGALVALSALGLSLALHRSESSGNLLDFVGLFVLVPVITIGTVVFAFGPQAGVDAA